MLLSVIALAVSLAAPGVLAQQQVWAQCGGIGWTGGTSCASGTICMKYNDWYSQCIPGSNPPTTTTSTTTTTTTTSNPPTTPTDPPGTSDGINYWFSFGDSYTQTGFDPKGTLPVPGNPLGNPAYPGWTATGGENWIDVCTVNYNKSLVLTYNYAYGGATIDANLVQPYQPTVLSLKDQVNQFLDGAGKKPSTSPWTSANALFSFWIGINDIGNSYYQSGDRAAFSDRLLDAYFTLIEQIFNVGGRNFLFVTVPCIERSPLMLAQPQSSRDQEKTVINGFNTKLAQRWQSFKSTHSGVTTYEWDSYATFTTILNSPTQYGFSDGTSYGNTNSFWGNDYHPGSKAHVLFGEVVRDQIQSGIW